MVSGLFEPAGIAGVLCFWVLKMTPCFFGGLRGLLRVDFWSFFGPTNF